MNKQLKTSCLTAIFLFASGSVFANDLEGEIEAIDAAEKTIKVQGFEFAVTDKTDFDDDAEEFADLKVGQEVEVDFEYRDGKHIAVEIEADD